MDKPEVGPNQGEAQADSTRQFLQRWGVIVTLTGLFITSGLTAYGLWIQNAALETQIRLLLEQSTATKQRATQLTIQDHALAAGVSNDLDQRNFQIQKLLFESPGLYAYFYGTANPKDLKKPDEMVRAQLIAEMFLDFMEAMHNPHIYALPEMKSGEKSWTVWDNYFRDLFKASKVMCNLVKDKSDWWSSPQIAYHSKCTCGNEVPNSSTVCTKP
jgi:hypothetical protein